MRKIMSRQVFNGTYGEMWFDDEYMAEASSASAVVNIAYEDVKRVGVLMTGHKMVGLSGEGKFKLHKVSSFVMGKVNAALSEGKTPEFTIILSINDPDAAGGERVALYHCKVDKLSLAGWEAAVKGEEEYNFTFEDWKILDVTE